MLVETKPYAPPAHPSVGPRRFLVQVLPAAGGALAYHRQGGCSVDHASEAMQIAGVGGRVSVQEVS